MRNWSLFLGVVPLCSMGDPRGINYHAAGAEQGWRRQHQRRLLRGALRPGRPALLCSGSFVCRCNSRPLPHPGGHCFSQQRPPGHSAWWAQPGEAEEVHDPHRRVQLPLLGATGYPVSLLHLRTESPQHLGEHLDQRPLSGVQHPLLLQGSCWLFTRWRCNGSILIKGEGHKRKCFLTCCVAHLLGWCCSEIPLLVLQTGTSVEQRSASSYGWLKASTRPLLVCVCLWFLISEIANKGSERLNIVFKL